MDKSVRQEMEEAISKGGSVYHKERIISSRADLPSEAELAKGDSVKESEALKSLEAQMKELQRQKDMLEDSKKAAAPAKAEKVPAPVSAPSESPRHGGIGGSSARKEADESK